MDLCTCVTYNVYALHTPQLLGWLEEKLPDAGKLPPEVSAIIPPLFSCLEDRSGDVRKKGQAVLPLFMAKVGYDTMLKHTSKLKVREGGKKREGREGGESRKACKHSPTDRSKLNGHFSTAVSAACLQASGQGPSRQASLSCTSSPAAPSKS